MNAITNTIQHSITPLKNHFLFAEGEVRTAIDERGEPWFCAIDVFTALGITWKNRAGSLKNYPENWISPCYCQGQSGYGEVIFISEPAVYKAIFSSRKPEAEAFANWVFEEVLPSIRRQGFYGSCSSRERLALARQISALTHQLSRTRDAFLHETLLAELRELHNLIGRPMPPIALLGTAAKQLPLLA